MKVIHYQQQQKHIQVQGYCSAIKAFEKSSSLSKTSAAINPALENEFFEDADVAGMQRSQSL